jgi:tRNA U38,U39,U40 pseudouridine synthase TruA
MIDIDVAEPQVYGNIEWLSVKIHGQSFMLHQIVSVFESSQATDCHQD